jgi:hypothetical protein
VGKKKEIITKGTEGFYKLNQHAPIFNDRRIKRNKTRSINVKKAIKESSGE